MTPSTDPNERVFRIRLLPQVTLNEGLFQKTYTQSHIFRSEKIGDDAQFKPPFREVRTFDLVGPSSS
jgi:hypothetical protein